MQALEFESSVKGNTLEIPAHLVQQVPEHSRVKVIMLMEGELEKTSGDNLKQRLLAISRRCAALPNQDSLWLHNDNFSSPQDICS